MTFPYDKQPAYAFVRVYLGDSKVDIAPEHLIDFSYDRKASYRSGFVGSSFSLSVFDDTAMELEALLVSGVQTIKFDYGWEGVPETYLSRDESRTTTIQGAISEYTLEFQGGGVVLSITGVSTAILNDAGERTTEPYDAETYGGSPSKIVRAIAEKEGWVIDKIVETQPISDAEGRLASFVRSGQTAMEFINGHLLDDVRPASGGLSVGYSFYFTEENKIRYEPRVEFNSANIAENISGSYEYFSGRKDNSVLGFTAEFKGILTSASGAGTLEVSAIDSARNEMVALSVSGREGYSAKDVENYRFVNVMGISSSTFEELEKKAINLWVHYSKLSLTASMDIVGDATVHVGSYIKVLVLTKYGLPHHTSGVYLVDSATDSISGANYTTSLKLWKIGTSLTDVSLDDTTRAISQYRGNMMENVNVAYPQGGFTGGDSGGSGGSGGGGTFTNTPVTFAGGSNDIVNVGFSKLGVSESRGDDEFIKHMNQLDGRNRPMDTPWCAMFVTWCARKAGVPTSVILNYSAVKVGWAWFQRNGNYVLKGSYIPKRGDIFFQLSNGASHTGIVVECDGTKYKTIEGNVGNPDAVRSYWRKLDDPKLTGFGIPRYTNTRFRGDTDVGQ